MPNVLIVFYSRTGITESLAKTIAETAQSEGAEVRVRRCREIVDRKIMESVPGWVEEAERMNAAYEAPTPADVEWADAVVLGSPTRFGTIASEVKAFLDSLGGLWFQGKLLGKVGSAFCSTSTPGGGNETTILHLQVPMNHFGFVIVAPGYGEPATFGAGTPYGASVVAGPNNDQPATEGDLAVARFQAKRVVEVARALKGA